MKKKNTAKAQIGLAFVFLAGIFFFEGYNLMTISWPKYKARIVKVEESQYEVDTKYGTKTRNKFHVIALALIDGSMQRVEFDTKKQPPSKELIYLRIKGDTIIYVKPNWSLIVLFATLFALVFSFGVYNLLRRNP